MKSPILLTVIGVVKLQLVKIMFVVDCLSKTYMCDVLIVNH